MKKIISLLLAIVLCLSMCACGSAPAQGTTEPVEVIPQIWSAKKTVDEFGDITEDSVTVLEASIAGDFSNSATTSSELTGYVTFAKKPGSEHYAAVIGLLEYGNSPVSNIGSNAISMKIKVQENVYEFPLTLDESSRELQISFENYDYVADYLFNMLYLGNDIRCIVNIGNSQYNFDMVSGNFQNVADVETFLLAPAKMTAKEAVNIYITDDGTYMSAAAEFFANERTNFEAVNSAELTQVLSGNFFSISIDTFAPYWFIFNYANGTRTQEVFLQYNSVVRFYEKTDFHDEYTTENDVLTIGKKGYQVYKLSDDIYVSYKANDNGEYVIPYYLMIRYNEAVSGGTDVYDEMLPYIQQTLIPKL